MDVEAVRAHFQEAQGAHAQRQSALAIRTRSGVAVNIWRTYGAGHAPMTRAGWRLARRLGCYMEIRLEAYAWGSR